MWNLCVLYMCLQHLLNLAPTELARTNKLACTERPFSVRVFYRISSPSQSSSKAEGHPLRVCICVFESCVGVWICSEIGHCVTELLLLYFSLFL